MEKLTLRDLIVHLIESNGPEGGMFTRVRLDERISSLTLLKLNIRDVK